MNAVGKIIISGLEVFAYHGVNPEEKEDGQKFILDITVQCSLRKPCLSDDVEDTISYAKICKTAVRVFTVEKNDLIERAAYRVAESILLEYGKADSVTIRLKKPDAPVKDVNFDWVAVEFTLDRGDIR